VEGRRLTAWAMARPSYILLCLLLNVCFLYLSYSKSNHNCFIKFCSAY
jgi:hypothetical protein